MWHLQRPSRTDLIAWINDLCTGRLPTVTFSNQSGFTRTNQLDLLRHEENQNKELKITKEFDGR